ncbi:similar to oxidoreductase [Plenodomus lingam JN3]|uniref:Similar to oxidoreductase n=2 Tax=Leptosphaeria maculans TaxID=5022 RepID=E4ZS05_LEPMJ|nr:similar to oxidoreductase [Plenodomus lingam JN3]CBX94185.1 similar to oxidoreductase [Plenodomus lingam JN3]
MAVDISNRPPIFQLLRMSQDLGQSYLNNGLNFTPTIHHDTYPYIDPARSDLSGKYVFITGASKGVGKVIALSYAKAGAAGIALGARSPLGPVVDEIIEAARSAGREEPRVVTLRLDVTDRASVESAARDVSEIFDGRLDVLINNAGYLSPFAGIPDTDPDDWWRDWEVNVKGVYLVTRSFWPLLLKSTLRIIINVTSMGALMTPAHGTAYGGAKLAGMHFTEHVNKDHGAGKDSMLVIAVHPGAVKTELALGLPEDYHEILNDEPALAGDTMVWLTRGRREWLGGRYISANWDMEQLSGKREEIEKGELLKLRLAVNTFPTP